MLLSRTSQGPIVFFFFLGGGGGLKMYLNMCFQLYELQRRFLKLFFFCVFWILVLENYTKQQSFLSSLLCFWKHILQYVFRQTKNYLGPCLSGCREQEHEMCKKTTIVPRLRHFFYCNHGKENQYNILYPQIRQEKLSD